MSSKARGVSKQTRNNWLVDAALFIGAVIAAVSGIYFLFLPVGGYQGGRNPMYGVTILVSRQTWEDWHIWGGFGMIAAVVIHFAIHWQWVTGMVRRTVKNLRGQPPYLNNRGRFNIAVDATIAASFLLTAVSGIYLYLVPGGAALRQFGDPMFLASRATWDLLHTWAGVVLIAAAVIHFVIHWGWVSKVTHSVVRSLPGIVPQRAQAESPAE
jgi:hypothetical protein